MGILQVAKDFLIPKPIQKVEEGIATQNSRASVGYDNDLRDYRSFLLSGNSDGVLAESHMRLSAVYRSIALISETIATMPFNLLKVSDNKKEIAVDYRSYPLYASEPNEFQTWFDFWLHIVAETLRYGNGYAYIKRDRYGTPISFQPLNSDECTPYYQRNGVDHFLYYHIFGELVESRDVIHIKCIGQNGVVGISPLQAAAMAIEGGLGQQNLGNSIYKNGLNLQGVLKHPAKLSAEAQGRLKAQMEKFKSAKSGSGTMLLEEGMDYEKISITPQDAQLLENKKFTVEEIARYFGVPQHKIGNLDRATNNNIEHQDLEFYKGTVSNWIERIEQEFNRKVLLPKEKPFYKHEFDVNKLLRADSKARADLNRALFNMAAKTPDEIRISEGLNPMGTPAMQKTYLQINMSDVDNLETNNGSNDVNKQDNGTKDIQN